MTNVWPSLLICEYDFIALLFYVVSITVDAMFSFWLDAHGSPLDNGKIWLGNANISDVILG